MNTELRKTFLAPIGDVGDTAGYAGITATSQGNKAATVAGKYLNNSLLLTNLTERVYQLLQEDLRLQRERVNNYSHPRWL
ncbi:hypothetical protein ACE1AT_09600 [Pelatocladus sp. BLCC-F211]|uniref:hypothetical protein n=1 Tax=Pelatocladus sp. BLCC-F211 TaxID=3342752 RepID=UPI0035B9070E